MSELDGKVAIITGASRGIGRSTAVILARHGAKIVAASRNKYGGLEELVAEITAFGGEATFVMANTGDRADIDNLLNVTLGRYKRIDVLVNNAATNPMMVPLVELPEEAWDKTMDVNLKACYLLSQRVGKVMIKQRSGNIINISSDFG